MPRTATPAATRPLHPSTCLQHATHIQQHPGEHAAHVGGQVDVTRLSGRHMFSTFPSEVEETVRGFAAGGAAAAAAGSQVRSLAEGFACAGLACMHGTGPALGA